MITVFIWGMLIGFGQAQPSEIIEKADYQCIYQVKKPKGPLQAESEEFVLLVGKSYTMFLGRTLMKKDSIKKTTNDPMMILSVTPSGVKGGTLSREKILFSRKEKTITVSDKPAPRKEMYYKENIKLNWEITNEIEVINEWKCNKARVTFAGRNYEVWFTKEIPLPVGPYKFFGLPGLIVLVKDVDCLFQFELINFSKLGNSKNIEFTTNGVTKSTNKEVRQAYIDFFANPQFAMEAAGITMTALDGSNMMDKIKPKAPPIFMEIIE